jgi:hypothetical protein
VLFRQRGIDPCRPLPAADVRYRPPPHLGAVHHRHRAAHPDRRLPAPRHPYQVRDTDGSPITPEQGRAIVAERYQVPPEIRAARRVVSNARSRHRRRDERTEQGVAKRSTMPPVPPPA